MSSLQLVDVMLLDESSEVRFSMDGTWDSFGQQDDPILQ